jgi:hypothetical protein
MTASVTLPANGNIVRAVLLETVMTFKLVYMVQPLQRSTKSPLQQE